MPDRTLLLTGYPGFLAGRLVPGLLAADPELRIVALVQPSLVARARALAPPPRVEIVAGDITDRRLGLTDLAYDRLARSVSVVYHLAALYDLAVGAEPAERVNVGGTQHVLDFCRSATALQRHHYVSTAYVAGLRSGRVLESELAEGQTFKNHYESTKFAAEVLVRASMDDLPTTVYRPAIVVGDSRTGETPKFDGPYFLLRALAAPLGPVRMQVGHGEAPFNVVPVDFVIDALVAGAQDPEAAGRTLHLVDPEPITTVAMLRMLAEAYDGRAPNLRLPPALVDAALRLAPVRRLMGGIPHESIRYANHPVSFDVTQAAEVLGRQGLRCPPFRDYVEPMVAFFRAHEADPGFRPGG
jgi:thioester reductase-like protein